MGEQVERILFQLEVQDIDVDKSVDDLRRRFDLLKKATQALDREAKALQKSLAKEDRTIDDAVKATKKLNTEQKKSVDIQKDLKRGIDATADARKESADTARLAGDVESRTRALTGAAGFVGGAGGAQFERQINIGAEALASFEAVGLLKEELPELAKNLGITKQNAGILAAEVAILAISFVVIKGLLGDLADGAKAVREAVQGQIGALRDFNEFIADATSAEVRTRLDEVAARREINAQLEQDLLELQGLVEAGIDISDEGLLEAQAEGATRAADKLGILNIGLKDIENALSETRTELIATDKEFSLLVEAFTDGSLAARDLARQEDLNTQAKIQGLQRESRILQDAQTITRKQLDERLAGIENERLAAQQLLDDLLSLGSTSDLVGDEIEKTEQRLSELSEETRLLAEIAAPLADIRAREAAALKLLETNIDLTRKAYEDAIKSQDAFTSALDKANDEKLQAEQDFADKTIEIEAKRQLDIIQDAEKAALDRTNDLADHYKDLADLDRDFFEERGDLLDDISADIAAVDDEKLSALKEFNKVEIQSTVDHLKRLEAIRLKSQNSIRSASARLDALGIFEAKQAAEEELKTENDKFAEEKKRRNEDFRDQVQQIAKERGETLRAGQQALRDLQQKHNRERQATIAAFNEKIRREDQQAALERNQQQQRWAHEDQQRQSQFEKEAMVRAEHLSLLLTLTSNGLFQIELAYQAWLDSVALRTGATLQTPVGVSGTTSAGTGNLPAFSSPAAITNGPQGVSNFRQPNAAPSPTGPGALGGITIPISINGAQQPIEVAAEVRRELDNVFAGMVA